MPDDRVSEEEALSTLYHALRATRRRSVIAILSETADLPVPVRELAKRIAAEEEATTLEQATGEPYRNAYNALSQTHLPMLADADIIIYDSDRQTVLPGRQLVIATMLVALGPPVVQALRTGRPVDSEVFDRQSTIE